MPANPGHQDRQRPGDHLPHDMCRGRSPDLRAEDAAHNASVIGNRRIVFNIRGNHYRLIVACAFRFGALYVKFVGTHAQHDAIDPETVGME